MQRSRVMKMTTIEEVDGLTDGTIMTSVTLQGRWYMNGDPNKPTDIHMNGRRLEATNENGKTTRLEMRWSWGCSGV